MAERTIIASGHSKGFAMTGWRLGWSLLPTVQEAQVFKQLNINSSRAFRPSFRKPGASLWRVLSPRPTVEHMVSAFQGRRDWIVGALNAIEASACQVPKGAFYVFPNVAGVCERLGIFAAITRP